jgi:hypothetical protein
VENDVYALSKENVREAQFIVEHLQRFWARDPATFERLTIAIATGYKAQVIASLDYSPFGLG